MNKKIEEIKKRRSRFTPGQLAYNQEGEIHHKHATGAWMRVAKCTYIDDTVFIAHAPEDIDFLLADHERLEKENEALAQNKEIKPCTISCLQKLNGLQRVRDCAKDYKDCVDGYFRVSKTDRDLLNLCIAKIEVAARKLQQAIEEIKKS